MGKNKYIETPERLLEMWDEYKAEVDANPDMIDKATNVGIQSEAVKKPYLRQGFEAFVYRKYGHHVCQYLDNQDGAYEDYLGVITCIRKEWEADQISGTLTGRYKAPNLTARINGFTDRIDATSNGKTVQAPIFGSNPLENE
jgi:hypothetical protein